MRTLSQRKPKRPPEFEALKRHVRDLARLAEGALMWLVEGWHVVDVRGWKSPHAMVKLAEDLPLSVASVATYVASKAPPLALDRAVLASAYRSLRAVEGMLDVAREHRRALARHGPIDDAWLGRTRARLDELAALGKPDDAWFERVVEVVRAFRADDEPALREARARLEAAGRRGEADLRTLGKLALMFPVGADPVALVDLGKHAHDVRALVGTGVTLHQAARLLDLAMSSTTRVRVARWVAPPGRLDLDLVAQLAAAGLVENLATLPDARAATAYATWATRLEKHYAASGISFKLKPDLFAHLPKNEDLAVLGLCLLEQLEPDASDPVATLDATLGLFQRLPAKARSTLSRLKEVPAGRARKVLGEFAAWLDDDALLDRCLHVEELAGESTLSSSIREDFEHATRTRREREHLAALAERSVPQQGRLDALLRAERTLEGSPKGRTRRRITERIERLLPVAYRRELDATFRQIMREAWHVDVPVLSPSWREAVRFWLVVDDNRELLAGLMESAARGRNPKRHGEQNVAWIARTTIDAEAWLAPRRRAITVDGARFVLELEEDPLEVLRMGIPFGTCLALEDGCNAASTVLNAIDANKRVLYVRNEAGRIVARKLLAISKDDKLVGYNLYLSLTGPEASAIRAAVHAVCRELSFETRAPLALQGEPARLHGGFWYDDGTVPFSPDGDVADYLATLGLAMPDECPSDLATEARGWRARQTGDIELACVTVNAWNPGLANRELGRFVCDELGVRGARARGEIGVFDALLRWLAEQGEDGLVRALDLSAREGAARAQSRLGVHLDAFPPSSRLAAAVVDLGLRAVKRGEPPSSRGFAHFTMTALPPRIDEVLSGLDCLDAIEPVWMHVHRGVPDCRRCVDSAVSWAADAILDVFRRAPDENADVVLAALTSKRRGAFAKRAALRIAARVELPGGARALARVPAELLARADGVGALVRHGLPPVTPAEPPFEGLAELVFAVPPALLAHDVDPKTWRPGPWELAWRRRQPPVLRERLVAANAVSSLVLLADVEAVRAHGSRVDVRAATILAQQAAAADAGRIDPTIEDGPHADARYVALALRELPSNRDALGPAAHGDLLSWALREEDAPAAVAALARVKVLPPRQLVSAWQLPEARPAAASAVARVARAAWAPRVVAAEREAKARGLSVDGLAAAVALALAEQELVSVAKNVDGREAMEDVVRVFAERAPVESAFAFYVQLDDALSASLFVRAVRRLPHARAAALREAAKPSLTSRDARVRALATWLASTLRRSAPSSIDAE